MPLLMDVPKSATHAPRSSPQSSSQNTDKLPTASDTERPLPGPHTCKKCNRSFSRADHLKRHISSSYAAPKSHSCQSCDKSFSRRDVLLRHRQSCKGAKANCSGQEELNLRDNCTNQQLDPTTKSNKSGGLDNRRNPMWSSREAMIELNGLNAPNGANERPESLGDDDTNTIRVDDTTDGVQRRIGRLVDTHSDLWFENQDAGDNYHQSIDGSRPNVGGAVQEQRSSSQAKSSCEEPQTKQQKAGNKRGRYTSIACMNCQKRKVKCSGEMTCLLCRSANLSCIYNKSRKRQNTGSIEERRPANEGPKTYPVTSPVITESLGEAENLYILMNRIVSLEKDRDLFKNHLAMVRDVHNLSAMVSSSQTYDENSPSCSSDTSLPISEAYHAGTALVPSIDTLNHTVAAATGEMETEEQVASVPIQWQHLVPAEMKDLPTLEKETRMIDLEDLQASVDLFFDRLNPQYPCLNENQFRATFQSFLNNETSQMGNGDWYQFIALLNIIHAAVLVLSHNGEHSGDAPGWNEFCRTENILTHLSWLGNGNLWTIQILLNKSRYLLLIEKSDSAYDVLGQCTRLLFQLGLHNQDSWTPDCTPFHRDMRQRLFWSIVCFDRNLALNNGTPVFLREVDFKVDFPKSYDDKAMFVDQPLPAECPERSSGLFITCMAKWGKLFLEIWDTMFGIHAQKPTSLEFVASIEARILYTVSQFPAHLQWIANLYRLNRETDDPDFVLRQTLIAHLRMNQLRLLIRQESMLNLKYTDETAEACVTISTNTIDVITCQLNSKSYNSSDRWASVLYLIGATLPLVCIILRKENVPQTRTAAIEAFKKSLSILNGLAVNFGLARHTLRKLSRIIGSAMQAIRRFQGTDIPELDSRDFETEILAPQITGLFTNDHLNDPSRDLLDITNQGSLSSDLYPVVDFTGQEEQIDAAWLEDLLNNEQLPYTN